MGDTMRARRKLAIAIVGPGRLGQAMGRLLLRAGEPVGFVAARQLSRAGKAARFIGGGKAIGLKDRRLGDAGIILVTTSDAAINSVARRLARLRSDWNGRVVLHTCGSLPASILDPFKKRGAAVGSLHPYQTVPGPRAGVRNLTGCYWAVEGDRKAVAVTRRWVKALDGKSFTIAPEFKPLYHLSAFLVCPTVVTLMDCSQRLLVDAGVPKKIIRPMLAGFVSETAHNFAALGAQKSLTGPAVRGDWATLQRHIAQLQRFAPEVIPTYIELVDLMLGFASGRSSSKKVGNNTKSSDKRPRAVRRRGK
ncbi:MAG TPA: Rossmann-like and DUF2520 domain-containing protein [Terriglobia bacterium]|nr:Rossmann-like and DUF2520 domain-containing protein [Terriglobia bacterium]